MIAPTASTPPLAAEVPPFVAAGRLLESLAAQDFAALERTLAPTATLRALLPRGPMEWEGAPAIAERFAFWFGDTTAFELVDATVGEVGGRVHLRWRIRLQLERLGEGWFVVEQQVYADADDTGVLADLNLLCTGYCPEGRRG